MTSHVATPAFNDLVSLIMGRWEESFRITAGTHFPCSFLKTCFDNMLDATWRTLGRVVRLSLVTPLPHACFGKWVSCKAIRGYMKLFNF